MLATETVLLRASVADAEAAPSALVEAEGDSDEEKARRDAPLARHRLDASKRRVPRAIEAVGRRRWEAACVGDDLPPPAVRPPLRARRDATRVVNRAYYKLREIQMSCGLAPCEGRTLHLCEAPGGFVQACEDDATASWRWCAVTLGGAIAPDATGALDRTRGDFLFADVRDVEATCSLVACRAWRDAPASPAGEVDVDVWSETPTCALVTADGACAMDHDRLEEEHFDLLVAQTAVALRFLDAGGAMVVKYFEGRCRETQRWIAYATTRFATVGLIKPTTSRGTNSERYLVARGYDGARDVPLPTPASVSALRPCDAWLRDVLCPTVRAMLDDQANALERALVRAASLERGGGRPRD